MAQSAKIPCKPFWINFTLVILLILPLIFSCSKPQPSKVVIGVVYPIEGLKDVLTGFKEGLAKHGYIEGQNLSFILTGTKDGIKGLDPEIRQMINAKVDLIYSLTTPATLQAKTVLKEMNSTIPVVFCPSAAPEKAGIVESLLKPGGNITGVKVGGFIPKQIEWLNKIAPGVKTLYAPFNPEDEAAVNNLSDLRNTAPKFGMELITREILTDGDSLQALKEMPPETDALIVIPCGLLTRHSYEYAMAAIDRKIPSVSMSYDRAKDGILICFGFVNNSIGNQAARIAAQVLSGISPSELPVETADFLLTINMKTAKAINLDIANEILVQANKIIR